mmetsp:Transcript_30580/g.89350  ORF Transcript_30580/g.89350 Transcript_30580/m.89350 type:complete len:1165 (+) Transcript_30580:324-3818(+)
MERMNSKEHVLMISSGIDQHQSSAPQVSSMVQCSRRRRRRLRRSRPSITNASIFLHTCAAVTCGGVYLSPVGAFQLGYIHPKSAKRLRLHVRRSVAVRSAVRDESQDDGEIAAATMLLLEEAEEQQHVQGDILSPSSLSSSQTRRQALMQMVAVPSALALASASIADPAQAARPEIDSKSGVMFSPKGQMLGGGGSDATRGIKIRDRTKDTAQQQRRSFANSVGLIQPVYNVRFVTYLSRFILNFDPSARSWWLEEPNQLSSKNVGPDVATMAEQLRFAEFAESVEVGLADYFTGPYGSYASLEAAKAGVNAKAPATSGGIVESGGSKFDFARLLGFGKARRTSTLEKKKLGMSEVKQKRQGIKNLLTLLKARYTTIGAKQQLALLFALIDDPKLQPAAEIAGLLGEADNASVTSLELIGSQKDDDDYRLSSRQGGGYAIDSPLKVEIEPPPALGQGYRPAKIVPIMRPTSRVLKIKVSDGGAGYKTPPAVTVTQKGVNRPCDAVAILDRNGSVESILVLDPGYGYGGLNDRRGPTEPTVQIAPPQKSGGKQVKGRVMDKGVGDDTGATFRQATAEAELEYTIKEIRVENPGSGYTISQPPKISIRPCERDPEWYVAPMTNGQGGAGVIAVDEILKRPEFLEAKVTKMTLGFYNTTVDTSSDDIIETQFDGADPIVIGRVAGDSLSLLPNSIRPQLSLVFDRYIIPDLPPIPEDLSGIALPSQKYRAIDPIFGGIGSKPVIIGAKDLTVGEYSRLALAGATCTVLVRTLLNPLELVKTKLQLENDQELLEYAMKEKKSKSKPKTSSSGDVGTAVEDMSTESDATTGIEEEKIGTSDLITSLVKLRGPLSLFQSADITFLASLVFGSFGFGATELFRRFFTNAIFEEGPGGGTGEELVLLGAAAVACVITSFAATPFEMIRVQSMGKVKAQGWTEVLADFLAEKRSTRSTSTVRGGTGVIPAPKPEVSDAEFKLKEIKKDDLKPLFSGFTPIASRELPFAITKFLVFDLLAKAIIALLNSQGNLTEPVQVGVGPTGLAISAVAGAIAGIAGAIISHPADLILTLQSGSAKSGSGSSADGGGKDEEEETDSTDWRPLVKELLEKDGGVANLFVGLPARSLFFFLVIGLQFFLYDFVKGLFNVSSDDLTLVLDVFYAIRRGLLEGPS